MEPTGALAGTLTATALQAELQAAGVDLANPPKFADLLATWEAKGTVDGKVDHKAVSAAAKPVMELFSKSLGVKCDACHSGEKRAVPEARAKLVAGMWDKFVVDLRLKEGGALFCDSCHQGKAEFLDRSDEKALGSWMRANFVGQLRSAQGNALQCATCHGQPFKGEFLDEWTTGAVDTGTVGVR